MLLRHRDSGRPVCVIAIDVHGPARRCLIPDRAWRMLDIGVGRFRISEK